MNNNRPFDPFLFTSARQQTEGWIDFRFSPEAVFARVADHASMSEWIPMVHAITVTQPEGVAGGESAVGTARHITFKGGIAVTETVVYWNPPYCYAYNATGNAVPMKDYIGVLSVGATGEQSGRLILREYFELGRVEQAVIPHGVVTAFKQAFGTLAGQIGGFQYAMAEVNQA